MTRGAAALSILLVTSLLVVGESAGARADRQAEPMPKMLYPTLDYGSRAGGLIWHHWIKPRHWTDGDDVDVVQAHWIRWNRKEAIARVRVVIAGRRGRGTVVLEAPGYCPAAHARGFLEEEDRGGPWGRGGGVGLSGECGAGLYDRPAPG
jgi:hypothetical protein